MYPGEQGRLHVEVGGQHPLGREAGRVLRIALAFLPMSHVMGRGVLYGSLASVGTVYFAAAATCPRSSRTWP